MKNKNLIISTLIPIVILASWSLYLSLVRAQGEVIELSIKARDPRDLLAGQYLTYAVDYGNVNCLQKYTDICICFNNNRPAKSSWSGNCNNLPHNGQCSKYLKASCRWSTPETGIEKYYIPEEYSPYLKRVPDKSSIVVRLDGYGNGIVTDFLIDQKPLAEYIKTTHLQQP